MPALEALLERFADCHTQPLGLSVDSLHCHANWGDRLGGISFPLLADFHPKGAVARTYGAYLESEGITDRATVLVDADGIVRHSSSVSPAGQRDIGDILAMCEQNAARYRHRLPEMTRSTPFSERSVLYVKDRCEFSRSTLLAHRNLHLEDRLVVRNVSRDRAALTALRQQAGSEQAPALFDGHQIIQDSQHIVAELVERYAPLPERALLPADDAWAEAQASGDSGTA